MLRFLRCYYLHFTRHSELLRGSFILASCIIGIIIITIGIIAIHKNVLAMLKRLGDI